MPKAGKPSQDKNIDFLYFHEIYPLWVEHFLLSEVDKIMFMKCITDIKKEFYFEQFITKFITTGN